MYFRWLAFALLLSVWANRLHAGDWTGFRGPNSNGVSSETGLPLEWSSTKNIVWQVPLPGPGASTPTVLGDRVFVTAYSGYGLENAKGDQKNLKRHLLCLNRKGGKVVWEKELEPRLPEHKYQGEGAYHGYAASTPLTDGERLYVFFGKSGVYCFDLDGNQLWHKLVGDGLSGWGSGCSPTLDGDSLIINASVESRSLIALDRKTGDVLWKAGGINSSWNTPLLVKTESGKELVVSVQDRLLSFDPANGMELWRCEGVHRYVCPSVVAHGSRIFAIGGGHTSLSAKAGGKGDVTRTHVIWRAGKGSNVSSPIYHEGHLYWFSDSGGYLCCQNAESGRTVFQQRLEPRPGRIWSSPVLADGRLYIVSQHAGTFVVDAKPEFKQLAHNVFEKDNSRANASPAISNRQIFLRTDYNLYCIGK